MSLAISIHAPTRGATKSGEIRIINMGISIHAPTRGATQNITSGIDAVLNFNPRSYKRSDLDANSYFHALVDFNPRSYKRSDSGCHYSGIKAVISIHAPTRGATIKKCQENAQFVISIHAPTRGATGLCRFLARIFTISIHAPTRGATYILYQN